jgi:hypothetical protein
MARLSNNWLGWAPPALTAAILAAMFIIGGTAADEPSGGPEYRERVREAIDAIPYRIGAWVGVDIEPTPAAVRLLTPNRILQRRYVNPKTGGSISLLIVHCRDARDMLGHFPPVCYPAHGWKQVGTQTVSMSIGGMSAPGAVYQFVQKADLTELRMEVIDFFVLPTDETSIVADMDSVERVARSPRSAGLGVAQIQIVFNSEMADDERVKVLREVLSALEPTVAAISRGVEP